MDGRIQDSDLAWKNYFDKKQELIKGVSVK